MRKIKFRGRVPMSDKINGGKIVYGYLMVYESGLYTHWICPCTGEYNYPVDPDSVKQLIAVDVNGREIYEGDKINYTAPHFDKEAGEFTPAKDIPFKATFSNYDGIRFGEYILVESK